MYACPTHGKISASHIRSTFIQRELIAMLTEALQPHLDKFDTFAFRGASGSLIAPVLAYLFNKKMVLIRKPYSEEQSHSTALAEGHENVSSYMIVDDFLSSGATVKAICEGMRQHKPDAQCYGMLSYHRCEDYGCNKGDAMILQRVSGNDKAVFICRDLAEWRDKQAAKH